MKYFRSRRLRHPAVQCPLDSFLLQTTHPLSPVELSTNLRKFLQCPLLVPSLVSSLVESASQSQLRIY